MSGRFDELFEPTEGVADVRDRRYVTTDRLIKWTMERDDLVMQCCADYSQDAARGTGIISDGPKSVTCEFSQAGNDFPPAQSDAIEYNDRDGRPFAWPGREHDAQTHLRYGRARSCDPATGRWVTGDPLGCEPADADSFPFPSE